MERGTTLTVSLWARDGNSFSDGDWFDPDTDELASMECWLYDPNWGYVIIGATLGLLCLPDLASEADLIFVLLRPRP
jgi:hypothetical protein